MKVNSISGSACIGIAVIMLETATPIQAMASFNKIPNVNDIIEYYSPDSSSPSLSIIVNNEIPQKKSAVAKCMEVLPSQRYFSKEEAEAYNKSVNSLYTNTVVELDW